MKDNLIECKFAVQEHLVGLVKIAPIRRRQSLADLNIIFFLLTQTKRIGYKFRNLESSPRYRLLCNKLIILLKFYIHVENFPDSKQSLDQRW